MPELTDLFAATEAVGDDDRFGTRGPDRRKQAILRNLLRHFEFFRLETKGAGHAAAASMDWLDGRTGATKHGDLIPGSTKNSLLMAMTMDENVQSRERADRKIGLRVGGEPVSEQPDLFA